MIHKDLTFEIILNESKEKEKSLERNFIFQCLLILFSLIYITVDASDLISQAPELFKTLLINKKVFPIIVPVLFTYYFARMGHNLYSYLYHRKLLYDFLNKQWDNSPENTYNFTDIYSSYTNSSFFEALNLFVLKSDRENERLERNNKLFQLYSLVFTAFLGLNHGFTLFLLKDFPIHIYVKFFVMLLFIGIILACYKVFLETYPKIKSNFILYIAIATGLSLVFLAYIGNTSMTAL